MSSDAVERIKERLSIVDVIAPYVELHSAGKNMKGKSPFTNEKTPSFYVSPDRGMYYCFSTSQGGDVFTFIQKMEGVDFKGALKILAEKAGVELVPEDPQKRTERDTSYHILEEATKFFSNELPKEKEAIGYLEKRGVKSETIQAWRVGYAPGPPNHGWRELRDHLVGLRFVDEQMFKVGLVKEAGEGKQPYDTFRDRIMFPIMDSSGRVVGYSGRLLSKEIDAAKYVNSPETELFNKSEILFGYDKAKHGIRQFDFSLIVEGQFDVILSHQAGYTNTVAVSGTALTDHHVSLLQRLSNRVVLALDADKAGISAVKRAAKIMLPRGVDLKVARLPEGKDPADMVMEDVKAFKHAIGESTHVIQFLLEVLAEEIKDERTYKLRVRDEVLPYLLLIDSSIDREHFIGVVAEKLKTTLDGIRLEIARLEAKKDTETRENDYEEQHINQEETKIDTHKLRQENLLDYLLVSLDVTEGVIKHKLQNLLAEILSEDPIKLRKELPVNKVSELTFLIERSWQGLSEKVVKQELLDRLMELDKLLAKELLTKAKDDLVRLEKEGSEPEITDCMKNISQQQKRLASTDRLIGDWLQG